MLSRVFMRIKLTCRCERRQAGVCACWRAVYLWASSARSGVPGPCTSARGEVQMNLIRCRWATDVSPEYTAYHDNEWGVPSFDDRHLFEMLILEGAQAGLSWSTILKKREGYRLRSREDGALHGSGKSQAARGYGDRAQPSEDRGGGGQCPGLPGPARVGHHAQRFRVGFRGRQAGAESMAGRGAGALECLRCTDGRNAAASGSSAAPSVMRSCRRSAWSTTTRSTASGMRSCLEAETTGWVEGGTPLHRRGAPRPPDDTCRGRVERQRPRLALHTNRLTSA